LLQQYWKIKKGIPEDFVTRIASSSDCRSAMYLSIIPSHFWSLVFASSRFFAVSAFSGSEENNENDSNLRSANLAPNGQLLVLDG